MALLLILVYVSFYVLGPFLSAIISSFVIVFIFYPLYDKILKRIKSKNISALLIAILVVLMIVLPSIWVINAVTKEATDLYSKVSLRLSEQENLLDIDCEGETPFCKAVSIINKDPRIRFYISGAVTNFASTLTRNTSDFLFSLPKKIMDVLIVYLIIPERLPCICCAYRD